MTVSPARINNNATSFKGGAPKSWVLKSEKVQNFLKKAGGLSTPANRLFLGATALAIQPEIDWHNKNVDEKTRKVSVARTISKIAIGTVTGIIVRQGCIDLMNSFTRVPGDYGLKERKILGFKMPPVNVIKKKWDTLLIPSHLTPEQFADAARKMKKHRQALGSIAALGVMLITNFLIDAPLTKICTNLIVKKMDDKKLVENKGGN